jgi:hypothetical protein
LVTIIYHDRYLENVQNRFLSTFVRQWRCSSGKFGE